MKKIRTLGLLGSLLVSAACIGFSGTHTALATTGNSPTSPVPALYKVPAQIAKVLPGQYVLKTVASGARLSHAQMVIELNPLGYLQAVGSFAGYDAKGFATNWVATFYNFRVLGPNKMSAEIFDPLGTRRLGTLVFQRTSQGSLVGQISLPKTPYNIQFQRNLAL